MCLVPWIMAGLLAGTLAQRMVAGERPWGLPADRILGAAGAVAGD